jgi:hypothetical protein
MEALELPAIERDIATRSDAGIDSVALPARRALEVACPSQSVAAGEGMIHGRVRNEQSRVIADGVVTTLWKTFSVMTTGSSASVAAREKRLVTRSDAFGYWRACGVPRDTPLTVSIGTEAAGDVRKVNLGRDFVANVDLVVRPRTAP